MSRSPCCISTFRKRSLKIPFGLANAAAKCSIMLPLSVWVAKAISLVLDILRRDEKREFSLSLVGGDAPERSARPKSLTVGTAERDTPATRCNNAHAESGAVCVCMCVAAKPAGEQTAERNRYHRPPRPTMSTTIQKGQDCNVRR